MVPAGLFESESETNTTPMKLRSCEESDISDFFGFSPSEDGSYLE